MLWLAVFGGGLVAVEILRYLPAVPHVSLAILLSIAVFFIVFGPGLKQALKTRGETAARRRRFEAAKIPETASMHECGRCGKTEHDDPHLHFRVTAEGEEYCEPCRAKMLAEAE